MVNELRHIATYIWVAFGLGYTIFPDGTKPLPEPMTNYYQIQKKPKKWNKTSNWRATVYLQYLIYILVLSCRWDDVCLVEYGSRNLWGLR